MASYDVIVKLVDQTKSGLRNIESGLTTIQSRAEQVNKTLDKLGAGLNKAGAVAGAALGLAAKSAISYADAIQDASNASGIATGTILAFSQGVATSGGEASRAVDAMVKFADAVGTAATGSYESRKAFAAIGISLQDLRTLSEEDLFKKTIQGLADINDLSLRAAAQNNIFGKTLKGVDIGGFAGDLEAAAAAQQKNAEAIKSAAAVVDQLKIGYGKLEIAILKALKPLSDWIGKISQDQMDRFIDAILKLGGAIVGLTAGIKVIQALGAVLAGVASAWGLFTAGSAVAAAAISTQIFRFAAFTAAVKGAWNVITTGTPLIMKIGGVMTTVATKSEAFFFILQRIGQTIGLLAARFLPLFVGGLLKVVAGLSGIAGIAYGVASAIDLIFDTKIIDTFVGAVKGAWDALGGLWDKITGGSSKKDQGIFLPQSEVDSEIKRLNALSKAHQEAAPKPNPYIDALTDQLEKAREAYSNLAAAAYDMSNINMASLAFGEAAAAAEKLGVVLQKPAELIQRDFNIALAKASEEVRQNGIVIGSAANVYAEFSNELAKAEQETKKQEMRLGNASLMARQFNDEVKKAALANKELAMKLSDAGLQQRVYTNEITAANLQLKDQEQRLNNAALQQALYANEIKKASLEVADQAKRLADANLQQSIYTTEIAKMNLEIADHTKRLADSNLQQSIYNNELAKGALSLQDQEKRLANVALQQGLFDQNIQKSRNDLTQQKVTLDLLNEAYAKGAISLSEYADALGNINSQLLGSKQLMSQALNDANKEVKSAELRKQAIQDLIDKYKEAGGTGTAAFKKAAEALGAQTPQIQSVVNEYGSYSDKVKEYNQDIEDAINSASKTFVDEFSSAFMKGEGMLDSFRNFFSNVMNDIAQRIIKKQLTEPIADALNGLVNDLMKSSGGIGSILGGIFSGGGGGSGGGLLSGIGGFLGDIASGIGSFFGFANGGQIGPGQVGIVGEKGPEFITGPANITPMDQAKAEVVPNVTFTLNAIDTQTGVQFLLQNKPAIVNMVSEAYNKRGRRGVNG